MNRRTCPGCGERSYSSYSGTDWDCPYCGKDLGQVPNELLENHKETETTSTILYPIRDGLRKE